MFTDAEVAEFRSDAESRMESRVRVWRVVGLMEQNEETGEENALLAAVHADEPFRLDGSSGGDGASRTVEIGGVRYEAATAVGHLRADLLDLLDDDLLEVLAGEWPGTVWRVVKATTVDQKTARRVSIVQAPRPTEWG